MGRRNVTVEDFYMERSDVAQLEYESYSRNADNPSLKKGDELPVESVTWNEAVDYCNLRSRKDSLEPCYTENNGKYECNFNANGYRLPTEAEWEYAFEKAGAEYRRSVLEWCWDTEGENRVVRGTTPGGTVSVRDAFPPDFRSGDIGFRVVRSRYVGEKVLSDSSSDSISEGSEARVARKIKSNPLKKISMTPKKLVILISGILGVATVIGVPLYLKSPKYQVKTVIRKSAEQGNSDAQNGLGWMYRNGYGVEQDYVKAVEWYRKSAEQGNAAGQNNLGYMYEHGYGVEQDYVKAVEWYRKSAEQGNARGQNNLGYMYRNGYGVEQDYGKAVEWYRKSAEQGDAYGQYNLGAMYEYGVGVTQDDVKAVEWYRKSAEQGDAYGQYNLGAMYEYGVGVTQDYVKAVEWYRKSAEQGNAYGQYKLGVMYENGKGVTKDISKAMEWYKKASNQGDESAKKALERLKKNR